jgi:hypothetical protein
LHKIFSILFLLVGLLAFSSCKEKGEDNPSQNGTGSLEVKLRYLNRTGSSSILEVYLYKSIEERDADIGRQNYYRRFVTDTNYAPDYYALFQDIDIGLFYVLIRVKTEDGNFVPFNCGEAKVNKGIRTVCSWIIPCMEPGNLFVIARDQKNVSYGGADVFLYKSLDDMNKDPGRTKAWRTAVTSNSDPLNIGAVFYSLPYQRYYFVVRIIRMSPGDTLTGNGDAYVPGCIDTKIHVIIGN